jgi:hypothetical protein
LSAEDGRSNWLEGFILMMVYLIIAVSFFFYPSGVSSDVKNRRSSIEILLDAQARPETTLLYLLILSNAVEASLTLSWYSVC